MIILRKEPHMTAMNDSETKPAPASAQARATKADRVEFLNRWAMEHPLNTIEDARKAVRDRFGLSLGNQILSNAMRLARETWEAQRKSGRKPGALPAAPAEPSPAGDLHAQATAWAAEMKAAGVRLLEVLEDGRIRLEFYS
jgi:hypothetical protein